MFDNPYEDPCNEAGTHCHAGKVYRGGRSGVPWRKVSDPCDDPGVHCHAGKVYRVGHPPELHTQPHPKRKGGVIDALKDIFGL